jgi:uncharacterized damage-inducible protein DinB
MRVADILLLYEYNYWAHERIMRQVARLTPEQFAADAGYSWGGVRGTLAHILGTERGWRARWQGTGDAAPPRPEPGTLEALAAAWEENRAAMRAYLATLRDDELDRVVAYTRQGRGYAHPLWTQLVHVVNHGTQHRGEVAVMLTDHGHSPGDIDFSQFMRERGG